MAKMVECPICHGRGQIGYCVKGKDGNACFDFECDFCKGRCWVSKKRADKYEHTHKDDVQSNKSMAN